MKLVVIICLLAAATPEFVFCQALTGTPGKAVGPGVIWRQETVAAGPLNINVMQIQLDDPRISIEAESAHDKLFIGEKLHQTARREEEPGITQIVGAINGDFYSLQNFFPIGLLVADGMIYDMPAKYRSAFVLTKDETPFIGPVSLSITLTVNSQSVNIDRLNSGANSEESVVLFTPPYGVEIGPAPGKRYILTMSDKEFLPNKPLAVRVAEADSASSTPLTGDVLILQIPSSQSAKFRKIVGGSGKGMLSAIMPEVAGVVASVCGGAPAIVVEGQAHVKHADERVGGSLLQKHPRTAIGFTKDRKNVFMVTVDGRQPKLSVGVTLDELAEYMKQLGCWSALNLDGGGSTTMVVNGNVVNHPSDFKGPRTIANSLLVVAKMSEEAESTATAANKPGNRPPPATTNQVINY